MAERSEITPDDIREIMNYDPDTGILTWKFRARKWFDTDRGWRVNNARFVGKEAANLHDKRGYLRTRIRRLRFRTHRVVWAHYYGVWPSGEIDHINGDKTDNRILNLREVSHKENGRNQKIPSTNTSGIIGVRRCGRTSKWTAHITVDDRCVILGAFATKAEAAKVRKAAEREHGFHPNHGRKVG